MLFSEFVKEVFLPWAAQHHKAYCQTTLNARALCEYFAGRTLSQISQLTVEGFKLAYSTEVAAAGRRSTIVPHGAAGKLKAVC